MTSCARLGAGSKVNGFALTLDHLMQLKEHGEVTSQHIVAPEASARQSHTLAPGKAKLWYVRKSCPRILYLTGKTPLVMGALGGSVAIDMFMVSSP